MSLCKTVLGVGVRSFTYQMVYEALLRHLGWSRVEDPAPQPNSDPEEQSAQGGINHANKPLPWWEGGGCRLAAGGPLPEPSEGSGE